MAVSCFTRALRIPYRKLQMYILTWVPCQWHPIGKTLINSEVCPASSFDSIPAPRMAANIAPPNPCIMAISTICFMISAFTKKNLAGTGLGIAVFMFAADMMCRIIPAIEDFKYVTPFYYANGADIFTIFLRKSSLFQLAKR